MEDVGGEGGQTPDVSAPGRGFDDPVASLVLVLRGGGDKNRKSVSSGDGVQRLRNQTHLLVVLDLVLQNDPVGPVGGLPGQRDGVSGDVLGLDGRHRRRS